VIESGVTVKEAQVLARHETPELTINIYGRAREERLWTVVEVSMPEELAEIVAAWPSLSPHLQTHIHALVRDASTGRKAP
jgi:hypothetical protein